MYVWDFSNVPFVIFPQIQFGFYMISAFPRRRFFSLKIEKKWSCHNDCRSSDFLRSLHFLSPLKLSVTCAPVNDSYSHEISGGFFEVTHCLNWILLQQQEKGCFNYIIHAPCTAYVEGRQIRTLFDITDEWVWYHTKNFFNPFDV